PPNTGCVVREQMNRDRRRFGDCLHEVNVVGRREERVEVAWSQCLTSRDLELRTARVASVVETAVDGFVLAATIDADETPREVIVDGRRGPGRHDEREQTERSILGTIEGVLADAAAHPARFVGTGAGVG